MKDGYGIEKSQIYNYIGNFVKDKKEGKGKIVYNILGDCYDGEFNNDSVIGYGVYSWNTGDVYTGYLKDGKMHGIGEYKWLNGNKYVGEYIYNVKQGKGKFYWNDGRIYDGEFFNGKIHGYGIMYKANKTYKVHFNEGKMIEKHKML